MTLLTLLLDFYRSHVCVCPIALASVTPLGLNADWIEGAGGGMALVELCECLSLSLCQCECGNDDEF